MYPPSPQQLDFVFGALADPTRQAILARLADGEATVNELVAPFDLSQPTISKHLKVLERAGDRKSTRLNSSHSQISYAVFCLKKKISQPIIDHRTQFRVLS